MVGERLRKILTPFQQFAHSEAKGGIMLMAASAVAFIWANSPWAEHYFHWQHVHFGFSIGESGFDLSLAHWVNDGLMAVFFLVVGLEIKRELLVGELSNARRAALAVFAALGGMVIPAGLYAMVNQGGEGASGWGIPMATDIAFALGVLSLLGKRVPLGLKALLAALAIVDDLGAVLVIAIFYTNDLNFQMLCLALGVWIVAILMGRFGVRSLIAYGLVGVLLWGFMLQSGVHATIAGVLLALAVPIRLRGSAKEINQRLSQGVPVMTDGTEQAEMELREVEGLLEGAQSPLHRLEHELHPWSAFLVMPVFALVNAGIAVGGDTRIGEPVTVGIFLGLLFGKPIGVVLSSWLAIKFRIAELPKGVNWSRMVGLGFLAGIGFTMSLFVTGLAFTEPTLVDQAKIGVLGTSLIAGIVGTVLLLRAQDHSETPT